MRHGASRLVRPLRFPLIRSVVLLVFALLVGVGAASATEANYLLGPQDRLRIRVWEWRAASGETYEWAALNGEFTIDPAGMLSVPLVGSIHAEGATTGEIAGTISSRLKTVADLIRAPDAAVEVIQYRPFYIDGAVERPGEYPFRPGMSVLQAVSIAGGFYRPESSLSRFERETIIAQGDIRVSEMQRIALTMRRDRLGAEARGADAVAFSEEVRQRQREPAVAVGMREETQIFATRRQALQTQVDLLAQANRQLEEELRTLAARSTIQARQVELARRELQNVSSLSSRGLAVNARQLAVEQNLAQMESLHLDLSLAAARTRQEVSRNERNSAELRNQRANEVLRELRETQTSLDQVVERIATFNVLLYDSQVTAPRRQQALARQGARLEFQIVRRERGRDQEIAAELSTPVLPGDVVRIMRTGMPQTGQEAGLEEPRPAASVANR